MRKYLKPAFALAVICAVSAILLSFLNKVTAPVIDEYEKSVALQALQEVSCGFDVGEKKNTSDAYVNCYYDLTDNGKTVGYILDLNENGYGGPLNIVAGFDLQGRILEAKLVSDEETPGVGKKAENKGYMNKFIGTGAIDNSIPLTKEMLSDADAQAVSGASLTFGGISRALDYGSRFVLSLGGR